MFGNPKMIFKTLKAMGIKIKFDVDRKALVIKTDSAEQINSFEDIEKMVNGNDNQG
jgi:hypothetical protein